MPQEMLAEDKHWSRWYLFSSYLIAQNTQPHTHIQYTHLGNVHSYTHSIHDYMQVFMALLMHICGRKKHTALQKQCLHFFLLIAKNSIEFKCKNGYFMTTNTYMPKYTHTYVGS